MIKVNRKKLSETFLVLSPSWQVMRRDEFCGEYSNFIAVDFSISILLRQLLSATHLSLFEHHKSISVLTYRITFITEGFHSIEQPAGVYILENTPPPPPPEGGGNKYGLMGKKYHENNARADKK